MSVQAILKRHWFLVGLALLIPVGLWSGAELSDWSPAADFPRLQQWLGWYPRLCTATILFLMAVTLDSRQIGAAIRAPKAVLWACVVNVGFLPLFAWPLSQWQSSIDFQIGLLIAACVPCTMAAASVWTRQAGGNDAVSLMVTVLTNGLCFAFTPAWLAVLTGREIEMSSLAMLWRLVLAVLLPCLLGQLLRLAGRPRTWATERKAGLSQIAQALILTLVWGAAWKAGRTLGGGQVNPPILGVFWVWLGCIALHVAAMLLGAAGGRMLQLPISDRKAVLFASSQKTLPIGVLIATDPSMFGNPNLLGDGQAIPFAVFPMLMFHASQLFIDTAVAHRVAKRSEITRA